MVKRDKKHVSLFASFIMLSLIVILAACSSDKTSGDSGKSNGSDEKKVYTFNLNSVYPDTTLAGLNFIGPEFIKEVEKRSNGRIVIKPFYSNELVPQSEILSALSSNTIDLGLTSPVYFGDSVPTASTQSLPYWSKSLEHSYKLYRETGVGELFEKELEEHGVKVLAYAVGGSGYGFALNKPIKKYEDLSKLLLRSSGWATDTWYKNVGISGASIPLAETYDALQRGVVDGTPWSFTELESSKYGEVVKYIVQPAFINGGLSGLFINKDAWNKLPEDLQKVMTEVAQEMELKALETNKEKEKTIQAQVDKYNIEVINLPKDFQKKLYDSAQVVWDEYAKLNGNTAKTVEILRKENGGSQ
ncbi:TRAP transporter substrate-binding protein [Neobacillus citreus]|uniref:TRAP transporter substrate-binding protein DctP n=1 Tax=Neobacillus citreus TaxID=2833578 RepID=A0A942YBS1_9BACI|nr:TRAP transporter substrate-binding protein DctP [Neobacillus citreus]MCH6267564.1 TRAP transporter substrate-binding protein DctP [Neobacillus citreus]